LRLKGGERKIGEGNVENKKNLKELVPALARKGGGKMWKGIQNLRMYKNLLIAVAISIWF